MSQGYPVQPQFTDPSFFEPQRRSSSGGCLASFLLIGIGIAILGGALCVAGVWYVTSNLEGWLVGLGREAIVAMIEESEIPDQEKTEVIAQVDRVVAAYKEGKIKDQDLERVLTELEQSPAFMLIGFAGMEEAYFAGSGLSQEEREQGRRTFQRVLRGVCEGKISEDVLYSALPYGGMMGGDEADFRGPPEITLAADGGAGERDDELRATLVKMKIVADNAGIPDEPFTIDIGDEVKKAVDKALAGSDDR